MILTRRITNTNRSSKKMQNTFVTLVALLLTEFPTTSLIASILTLPLRDVCDAPVSNEWFYLTNSYHNVADKVDLLFSRDEPVSRLWSLIHPRNNIYIVTRIRHAVRLLALHMRSIQI